MLKRIPAVWKLGSAFVMIVVVTLAIYELLAKSAYLGSNQLLLLLTTMAVSVALSLMVARYFVKLVFNPPLEKLTVGMNKLAEKEFGFRVEEDYSDEFSGLYESFNDMASMLEASLNELKKARDYLEGILETTADIIITVSTSGRIMSMNTGAENVLGYNRLEVIGQPIEMIFANPSERDLAIHEMGNDDNVVNYQSKFITSDGRIRNVLLTISRLRNHEGEIIGTIGISKDISREIRLQRELVQSQRLAAIGEVFTGVQHSLKNMLNACKGGAYMVKIGFKREDMEMLGEGWDIVQDGISRMTEMSLEMLKFVKEWKPKIEQVNLIDVLLEVDKIISKSAENKGVTFRLQVNDDLPQVPCDKGMIHSAVMDLVSNAIDACTWKEYKDNITPAVSLTAYIDNNQEYMIIEVIDNGIGMTEEVKKKIFKPFFTTKSKAGTGLGLAITARMIEVHRGKFEVDSEPDVGTKFRIVLPYFTGSTDNDNGSNKKKEKINGEKSLSS